MNAGRHEPGWSVINSFMICGVMIAPMEAPLCNTLLPIVRSFSSSNVKVVFNAHGQWPALKKPSSVRQMSSPLKLSVHPAAMPIKHHAVMMAGYSR